MAGLFCCALNVCAGESSCCKASCCLSSVIFSPWNLGCKFSQGLFPYRISYELSLPMFFLLTAKDLRKILLFIIFQVIFFSTFICEWTLLPVLLSLSPSLLSDHLRPGVMERGTVPADEWLWHGGPHAGWTEATASCRQGANYEQPHLWRHPPGTGVAAVCHRGPGLRWVRAKTLPKVQHSHVLNWTCWNYTFSLTHVGCIEYLRQSRRWMLHVLGVNEWINNWKREL